MKMRTGHTKIGNAFSFLRSRGIGPFVGEVMDRLIPRRRYAEWIRENEPSEEELERQKEARFTFRPEISIVVVMGDRPARFPAETLRSLLRQSYPHWELIAIAGVDAVRGMREAAQSLGVDDVRIRIEGSGDICAERIAALAGGEYLMFPRAGDALAPFALYEAVRAINESPGADIVYSDEDLMGDDGRRSDPDFKPDWSPDYLRSHNYIGHSAIIRRKLVEESGSTADGFDGDQNYGLILGASERARTVLHVPKVLYHRRGHDAAHSQEETGCAAAPDPGREALRVHLRGLGEDVNVQDGFPPGFYKVAYGFRRQMVSIVIPSRDHASDLKQCVQSIVERSSYDRYEIIIVENGSVEAATGELYEELRRREGIRVITWQRPFNYSSINNFAAEAAEGEVLLFLNNDMQVISGDWLERMLEHALRREIGAVGAKLYYPDDTIQHAGVVLLPDGNVLHRHRFLPRAARGYQSKLCVVQNMSAVTGACMMVRKKVFEEAGRFDERYEVIYGDIDLCMKIREKGYRIVWTPYAELYHHELKTRGHDALPDNEERAKREVSLFRAGWGHVLEKGDPYYSPNLALDREDFSVRTSATVRRREGPASGK